MPPSAVAGWCWALGSLAAPSVSPARLCQLLQRTLDDTQDFLQATKLHPPCLVWLVVNMTIPHLELKKKKRPNKFGQKFGNSLLPERD